MSVAVAVSKGGRIALATDSQTNMGQERVPPENLTDTKYHAIGDAFLATTGWTLYSNILDDLLRGKRPPRLDDEARIFRFFNELWKVLHEHYSFVKDQSEETGEGSPFGSLDSSFMVVSRRGIFSVSPDLSVMRLERYFAIGSGAEIALGAAHALYGKTDDPERIAHDAAEAAIAHNIYCGPPINVVSLALVGRRTRRPTR